MNRRHVLRLSVAALTASILPALLVLVTTTSWLWTRLLGAYLGAAVAILLGLDQLREESGK